MAARDETTKGRVLVIEDDDSTRQAIADLLHEGGYSVHPLTSPIGAIQVIATQDIVAAVVDSNMTIMTADRFVALLRTWDRIRDLPVVLISGPDDPMTREAAANLTGVTRVARAELHATLVATVGSTLLRRPPGPPSRPAPRNEPPVARPAQPTAQACLSHWRDLVAMRGLPMPRLIESLDALRSEVQTLALTNTAQLVTAILEIAELCGGKRTIVAEVDSAVAELLSALAGLANDKAAAFDQSLSLTIHRSRLDRARQLLR